jgi:MarR family transcriptional regulator, transcriptional regulator for hemolysin
MATTTPRTDVDLAFLLAQTSHALATEMTARLEELGISPRDHCVLTHALAEELTQSRLAELCALDKTTMVVTMDGLERAGLAERRPSATDRRVRIIAVTPKGERLATAGREIIDRVYEDVLAALPARERAAFVSGLTRLASDRLATPVACERPVRRRAPRG